MNHIVQILLLAFAGIILLWFGYLIVFFAIPQSFPAGRPRPGAAGSLPGSGPFPEKKHTKGVFSALQPPTEDRQAPRVCPVCAALLEKGERVKSVVFPSPDGRERTMRISGCAYCLDGGRERKCPVCGAVLRGNGYLIARLFEKPGRSHVHVRGCSRCVVEKA